MCSWSSDQSDKLIDHSPTPSPGVKKTWKCASTSTLVSRLNYTNSETGQVSLCIGNISSDGPRCGVWGPGRCCRSVYCVRSYWCRQLCALISAAADTCTHPQQNTQLALSTSSHFVMRNTPFAAPQFAAVLTPDRIKDPDIQRTV